MMRPPIICLAPINWDDEWEGPQEIMSHFARSGAPILYVEPVPGRRLRWDQGDLRRILRRLRDLLSPRQQQSRPAGLIVATPFLFPPGLFPGVSQCNRWLLGRFLRNHVRRLGWRRPVAWTYNPSSTVRTVLRGIEPGCVIYACIHDLRSLSTEHVAIAAEESAMIADADLTFVLSRKLLPEKARWGRHVELLPQHPA